MTSTNSALDSCDIAIIGAGPYGLSAAAHLKASGLTVRIFGSPMEFWADKMPAGMLLRSPREASNIADPQSALTLEAYETASGTTPASPLALETFVAYGRWFERESECHVERTNVASVQYVGSIFKVTLECGESFTARRVVVAAGVETFRRRHSVFQELPAEAVSHCYEGRTVAELSGKRVAVIGAGQSALESAALLHEAKCNVEVIARTLKLRWIGMHSWLHHLGPISSMLYSRHDVGPAGISRLVAAPRVVVRLPLRFRDKIRKRAVRSAGSRWLPARLKDVKISTGRSVVSANAGPNGIRLTLDDGSERLVDHVLTATGYDVDISRYRFLSPDLLSRVDQFDGYPCLGSGFTSSVPGLHFIGATAARSFGPLLYFIAGSAFASKHLTSYILRKARIRR